MSAELVYNVKFNIDPAEKKKITDIGTTAPVKLTIDDTEFEEQFQELRGNLKAKVFLEADATQLKTSIDAVEVSDKEVLITPFLDTGKLSSESAKIEGYFKAVAISISRESISNVQAQLAPLFASRIIDVGFAVQEVNLEPISSKISSIESSVESVRSLFSEVETASTDANVSISFFADRINEVDVNVLKKINEVGLSLYTIGEGFGSFSTNLGNISSSLSEFATDIGENMVGLSMFAAKANEVEDAAVGAAAGFNKFKEAVSNFRSLNNVNKKLQESIKLLKEFSEITSVSVSADAVDDLTRNYEEVSKALENATKELDAYKEKVDELSKSSTREISDSEEVERSVKKVSKSRRDASREAEELSIKFKEVSREEMSAIMESARMQERAARSRDKFSESTEELTDKEEKLRNVFFQEEQALKTLNAVTSNYDAEVRKIVTTGVKDIKVLEGKIERLKETRKQLEDQIALVTNLARVTELSAKEQEGANKALAQGQRTSRSSTSTTKAYENSLHMLIGAQGDLTRQAGLGNKQFSAINQAIFSFGDLVQDASQFQFGFAQGMRAVGNNIAFTAELFAVSQANVERHNKAIAEGTLKGAEQITMFQAFKNQLIGPTGVVLAVNVAVTAISFLSAAMKDSKEETEDNTSAMSSFAKAVASARNRLSRDPLGVRSLREQQLALQELLTDSVKAAEEWRKSMLNLEFEELLAKGIPGAYSVAKKQIGDFSHLLSPILVSAEGLTVAGGMFALALDRMGVNVRKFNNLLAMTGNQNAIAVKGIFETLEDMTVGIDGVIRINDKAVGHTAKVADSIQVSAEAVIKTLEEISGELQRQEVLMAVSPILRFSTELSQTTDRLIDFSEAGADNEHEIREMIKSLEIARKAWLNLDLTMASAQEIREQPGRLRIITSELNRMKSLIDDPLDELQKKYVELSAELNALTVEQVYNSSEMAQATRAFDAHNKSIMEYEKHLSSMNPEVVKLATYLIEVQNKVFEAQNQIQARNLVESYDKQFDAIGSVSRAYDEQIRLLELYNAQTDVEIENIDEIKRKLKELRDAEIAQIELNQFKESVSSSANELLVLQEAGVDVSSEINTLRNKFISLRNIVLANRDAFDNSTQMIEAYNDAINALSGDSSSAGSSTRNLSDELFDLAARTRKVVSELQEFEIVNDIGDASGKAAQLIFNQSEAILSLTKEIEDARKEMPQLVEGLEQLMEFVGERQEQEVLAFGQSLRDVFSAPKTEVEQLTEQYEENVRAFLWLINTQKEGSSVYNELIQQLLELEQGYKDSKDAIVSSNRAELESSIAIQRALLDKGEYYADATELIQEHRFAMDNAIEGNEQYEQTLSELQAQTFIQNIFSQYVKVNDEMSEFNRLVKEQRDSLILLREVFPNLVPQEVIDRFDKITQKQEKAAANQEIVNNLMAARELVDAGGVFAEIFGASKEFQIALATTSGLLAIVQTLADPSKPTLLMKLAASATIAATVAKQIQAIKNTEIGSAQNISQDSRSQGTFTGRSSMTEVAPPTQNISFAPTSQSDGAIIVINNEVVAKASELAVLTRVGERDISNSQKTIR